MLSNKAKILKVVAAKTRPEGKGVQVQRILGADNPKYFDPFLMLDYAVSRQPNGFPDHPHRGFETVTYATEGTFIHEDFKGHKGIIEEGGVQWMTAGRGILHSEVPGSKDHDSKGYQLWINLKSSQKMMEPYYQEFKSQQIPLAHSQNVSAKLICGSLFNTSGPVKPNTPVEYFDIFMQPKGEFTKTINKGWNSFIYLYEGQLLVNDTKVESNTAVFFASDDQESTVHFNSETSVAKFLWLSGLPLKEPIVQYGPFVMNTQEEIDQTLLDYQEGKNGFENAKLWKSENSKLTNKTSN